MLALTKARLKSYQDAKVCYICRKKFLKRFANEKNYVKVRENCHFTIKYRGLYVLVMSRTRFRANPHSIVA